MALHGMAPGPRLLDDQLPLVFALIWSLFQSNWLTSLLGFASAAPLARLTALPTGLLVPVILGLVAIGAVAYRGERADLMLAAAFGVLGYLLRRFSWPRVPFVIVFVLGAVIEDNLLLTLRLAELGRIGFWDRPVALGITALVGLTLAWALAERRRAAPAPDSA